MDIGLYTKAVDMIGPSGSDLIINLTTGEGGRFIPTDDDPCIADLARRCVAQSCALLM
jgi:uncharacterized protein (DUF849 family)